MPTTDPAATSSAAALAARITARREELGLTPELAAAHAGTGVSTWTKYERTGRIGRHKIAAVCRALYWSDLDGTPGDFVDQPERPAWSRALALRLGDDAAIAYADASDELIAASEHDLDLLGELAAGTHLGVLPGSQLRPLLPDRALVRYDYEFVIELRDGVERARESARGWTVGAADPFPRFSRHWSTPDESLEALAHRLTAEPAGASRADLAREIGRSESREADALVRDYFDARDRRRLLDLDHGPHLCWKCAIEVERSRLARDEEQLMSEYARDHASSEPAYDPYGESAASSGAGRPRLSIVESWEHTGAVPF